MKHIIFVKSLKEASDRDKIAIEMENTRLEYSISLATGSVTIEGSNDAVFAAKNAIRQAGYEIS